jgi:hypothetical protein
MNAGELKGTVMNTRTTRSLVMVLLVSLACSFALVASAAPTGKKFKTPEQAVDAFIGAVRNYDLKALVKIFGKGSERLFETGDPVADQNIRTDFVQQYDIKHEIADKADGSKVLVVGTVAWPFTVPLVQSKGKWQFDTESGMEEIINRRIGRNELTAIQTCLAIGDAQRDYFRRDRDGDGIREYAQKFRSTPGMRDGLFWRPEPDEPPSPLGELLAAAAAEGYTIASTSYNGYQYRLLSAQGSSAPGGAYEYMARDNQIGGFAVIAFPAFYGDSGIMTFALSHSGVVYQRDLGEATPDEVLKITTFDPGNGWTKVPDKDLEPIPAD